MKRQSLLFMIALMLFTMLFGQGAFAGRTDSPIDGHTGLILAEDPSIQIFPTLDDDGKHVSFALFALIFTVLIRQKHKRERIVSVFPIAFAFLTAVFYQSNYVIKPL